MTTPARSIKPRKHNFDFDNRENIELDNNLLNIRRGDNVYEFTERRMRNLVKSVTGYDDERLNIGATDAYYIYYSHSPLLRPKNEDTLLEKVRQLFENVMKTPEYKHIKAITTYNRVLSETYATLLIKKLMEYVEKEIQQMQSQQNQQNQQNQGQQQQSQGQQNQQNQNQNQQNQFDNALNKVLDNLTNNKAAFRQMLQEVNNEFENAKMLYNIMVAAGKEPAAEKLIDYTKMLRHSKAEDILKYTEGLLRHLRNIHVSRYETPHGTYNGYVRTHKIEKMIPRELATDDELFDIKLIEGGLAYRRTAVKEGDIIVVLDDSGSMEEGEKEVWARSVAMALLQLALMSRRKYRLILFDESVHIDTDDVNEIIDTLLHKHYGGGTSIDKAINAALKHNEYSTIVLITDGEDNVATPPEALKGRKLIAVMIKGDNDTLKQLAQKSNGVYMKARLTEDGAIDVISETGVI